MKPISLLLSLLVLTSVGTRSVEAQPDPLRNVVVIVNSSNPVASLSSADLSRIFMKRDTRWQSGTTIQPVDLDPSSTARAHFTSVVHKRSVAAMLSYWQQQIFAGREVPPPVRASEAEVIEYVRENPRAIGYVSAGTSLSAGVKTVTITR